MPIGGHKKANEQGCPLHTAMKVTIHYETLSLKAMMILGLGFT